MKATKGYRIWQIVYPIGIYYVVSSLAYFVLELLLGNENSTYMLRQMVCSAVTIPFVLSFYRQDKKIEDAVYGRKDFRFNGGQIKNILFSLISAAAFGIAVNNLIAMTPLIRISQGFQQANEGFFGGNVLFEILGSCFLIPIAEELLFRGVIYKRLRVMFGVLPGLLLSGVIFGVLHVNLVQFLYAGILGILLAFLLEKTGYLYTAILGHIAANTVAVARSRTGWLDFAYQPTLSGIGFTLLMAAVSFAMILYMLKEYKGRQ